MIESFRNIFAIPDLRRRLFFTFALLAVYRLGSFIPIPGIDPVAIAEFTKAAEGTLLGFWESSEPHQTGVSKHPGVSPNRALSQGIRGLTH